MVNTVTSRTPTSFQQKQASWTLGSISGNEGRGDYSVRDSLTFSKKARHSDTDNDKIRDNGDGVEERNRRLLTNGYGMEVETAVETHNGQVEDPYQHINNLEVAIEYLRSFVMECANSGNLSLSFTQIAQAYSNICIILIAHVRFSRKTSKSRYHINTAKNTRKTVPRRSMF